MFDLSSQDFAIVFGAMLLALAFAFLLLPFALLTIALPFLRRVRRFQQDEQGAGSIELGPRKPGPWSELSRYLSAEKNP